MDSRACTSTAQVLVTEEMCPFALKQASRLATQFTVAFHHIWKRAFVADTAVASKFPSSVGDPSACSSLMPSAGHGERRTQSSTCWVVSLDSLQLRQMVAWTSPARHLCNVILGTSCCWEDASRTQKGCQGDDDTLYALTIVAGIAINLWRSSERQNMTDALQFHESSM